MALKLVRRDGAWWIMGDGLECGPYRTRREADEDRRGLERTRRYGHLRSFWTAASAPPPKDTKESEGSLT